MTNDQGVTKWKMVPVEPTPEMVETGSRAIKDAPDLGGIVFENTPEAYDAYKAMLQAAPTPPPLPSEDELTEAIKNSALSEGPALPDSIARPATRAILALLNRGW